MMTLLVEMRLTEWVEKACLLPDSQNGFRKNKRTHNNSFTLRCAAERASAAKKPLFTLFIDLTNVFPSTDISTLWMKMFGAGAGGPIFDWLRMLYARMTYVVTGTNSVTAAFKSLIGVLTGDTASPILWNIYFADIENTIPRHDADISLDGTSVCHTEQADDVAVYTTCAESLQLKGDGFADWAVENKATISGPKSELVRLGYPAPVPICIRLQDVIIREVATAKYVGIYFTSGKNMFLQHYIEKAKQARRVLNIMFTLEKYIGLLSVLDAIRLYLAQIDPHLTTGAEVVLDGNDANLKVLERVQNAFIRRALGLSSHSIVVALFSESGLMPVRYRRILFAVDYWGYVASLPSTELPVRAMRDSFHLCSQGHPSWAKELRDLLANLPVAVIAPNWCFESAQQKDWCKDMKRAVTASYNEWMQAEVLTNGRLQVLRACTPRMYPSTLPCYLRVANPTHRRALTRLVFSEHPLAVEQLRRGDHYRLR